MTTDLDEVNEKGSNGLGNFYSSGFGRPNKFLSTNRDALSVSQLAIRKSRSTRITEADWGRTETIDDTGPPL